jgi:hypothetical protein
MTALEPNSFQAAFAIPWVEIKSAVAERVARRIFFMNEP